MGQSSPGKQLHTPQPPPLVPAQPVTEPCRRAQQPGPRPRGAQQPGPRPRAQAFPTMLMRKKLQDLTLAYRVISNTEKSGTKRELRDKKSESNEIIS